MTFSSSSFSLSHFPHEISNHDTQQPEACEFIKPCNWWTSCSPGQREKRRSAQIRALFLHSSLRTPILYPAQVTQSGGVPGCWDSHGAIIVFLHVCVWETMWHLLSFMPSTSLNIPFFLTMVFCIHITWCCVFSDFFVLIMWMLWFCWFVDYDLYPSSSLTTPVDVHYGASRIGTILLLAPFFCCVVHMLCLFMYLFSFHCFSPHPQISAARGCQSLAGLHVWR